MLLIVLEGFGAHEFGYVAGDLRLGFLVVDLLQRGEHVLDILSVVLAGDLVLRVLDAVGLGIEALGRRDRIGRVDVQIEVRHDEQMVPQLVLEVGRLAQNGIQVAHHLDDGARLLVAQVAVVDRLQVVDHLMHMTPVLGKHQLLSLEIIVFIHKDQDANREIGPRPRIVRTGDFIDSKGLP